MAEQFEVLVIGGGQAGLAAGYHLAQQGRRFAILEQSARIGDSWRNRWGSLTLFTSARYSQLPGRHTLTNVSLADLAATGLMPREVAQFLDAAIQIGRAHV